MQCNATNSCVRAWKPVAFVFCLGHMNFLSCSKLLWVALANGHVVLIWSNCCGPVVWDEWKSHKVTAALGPFFNFWDKNEHFFLSVSCFKTRTRISVFHSCASKREWECFLSVSCFETRTRIPVFLSCALRWEQESRFLIENSRWSLGSVNWWQLLTGFD